MAFAYTRKSGRFGPKIRGTRSGFIFSSEIFSCEAYQAESLIFLAEPQVDTEEPKQIIQQISRPREAKNFATSTVATVAKVLSTVHVYYCDLGVLRLAPIVS